MTIEFTREHPMTTPEITREEALAFREQVHSDDVTFHEDLENVYRAITGNPPEGVDVSTWYYMTRRG